MQLHLLVKCPFATEKNNTEIDDFQDEYISLFNKIYFPHFLCGR